LLNVKFPDVGDELAGDGPIMATDLRRSRTAVDCAIWLLLLCGGIASHGRSGTHLRTMIETFVMLLRIAYPLMSIPAIARIAGEVRFHGLQFHHQSPRASLRLGDVAMI
jgi:hypothetical protein